MSERTDIIRAVRSAAVVAMSAVKLATAARTKWEGKKVSVAGVLEAPAAGATTVTFKDVEKKLLPSFECELAPKTTLAFKADAAVVATGTVKIEESGVLGDDHAADAKWTVTLTDCTLAAPPK